MKKKCYVYYDKFSKNITEILNAKKDEGDYIVCDKKEVLPILSGKIGMMDLMVCSGKIVERSKPIKLERITDEPYEIPYSDGGDFDMRVVYYPDNVLEITLNVNNLMPDTKFERGSEFRITLKTKSTDELLRTIIIPANDILLYSSLYYELYDHIKIDDVVFFTERVFKNYYWTKRNLKLTSPMKNGLNFHIHIADTEKRTDTFQYHLEMKYDPDHGGFYSIKNNIQEFSLLKIYEPIKFFIVDENDYNILYDTFEIDPEMLVTKDIGIMCKTNPEGKLMLYNHKYISVLLEK